MIVLNRFMDSKVGNYNGIGAVSYFFDGMYCIL